MRNPLAASHLHSQHPTDSQRPITQTAIPLTPHAPSAHTILVASSRIILHIPHAHSQHAHAARYRWRTCFSWHTEDYDLFAINYLHYGEPKQWWGIPQHAASRFQSLCEGFFAGQVSAIE